MDVTQQRTQVYGRPREHRSSIGPVLPLPMLVGRYWLLEQIAKGGMATVYKGRLDGPEGFARTVAIKRLHPHLASSADFVEQFASEARLAARIHHGNVVQTLDFVHDRDELFLVLEYVEGLTLGELLSKARDHQSRLPTPISGGILFAALQGLCAAHELGDEGGNCLQLVHQDFSPQNVLVGVDGVGRVLDFGVARVTNKQLPHRTNKIEGKLAYMSPEQITAQQIDQRSDIFSAGIVLWEALAGRRLFGGAGLSQDAVLDHVLLLDVLPPSTFNPTVPKGLDAVVLRALQRDPDRRFPSARDFAAALHSAAPIASSSEISAYLQQSDPPEVRRSEAGRPAPQQDQTRTACEVVLARPRVTDRSSIRWSLNLFALALAGGAAVAYLWPDSSKPPPVSAELATVPSTSLALTAAIPSVTPPVSITARRVPARAVPTEESPPSVHPKPPQPSAKPPQPSAKEPQPSAKPPQPSAKPPPTLPKESEAKTQAVDCSVPTYTDAEGISHFKVHCL